MPGEFRLEGDNGLGSVDRPSGMLGAGDMIEIEDPDFMFGDNGELIDIPRGSAAAETPAGPAGVAMSGDAAASVRVRREHEEGRQAGFQVSFTRFSHVFLHCPFDTWSYECCGFASLELQSMATHDLTCLMKPTCPRGLMWLSTITVDLLTLPFFLLYPLLTSFMFPVYYLYIMGTDPYQFPGDRMDMDLPIYGENHPEGEAFSSSAQQQSSQHSEVVESSDTFAAPMRRRRVPRALPTDAAVELRNKELAEWNTNYRENMKAAAREKIKSRAAAQAKRNAEHYVWGSGIGGIGARISNGQGPNPLDMFIGDNLFELVTGVSRKKVSGAKHDRDSGIDDATQEESRRVRQKTGEPEVGRGADDEGFFMPGGDDVPVELPREAVSALDDQQIFSAMPWNISASVRGSSAIPRSGRVGTIGSVEHGRHGSRMVSASPLHGRGQPSALEGLKNLTSDADYGGDDFGLPGPSSDFPEPAAPLETSARVKEALSTEGENFLTFVTESITEKRNRAQANLEPMSDILQAEAAADIEDIAFEELLPPAENTKMVACQGLMMVLALGMKGMLDVQQPEDFGEIGLKLTEKAKATQVIEISDGEESDDDDEIEEVAAPEQDDAMDQEANAGDKEEVQEEEMQEEKMQEEEMQEEKMQEEEMQEEEMQEEEMQEEEMQEEEMQEEEAVVEEVEGHFQEQFAAGHAAQEDEDHDSLYDD
jgi:meiotic recombination protein REC8